MTNITKRGAYSSWRFGCAYTGIRAGITYRTGGKQTLVRNNGSGSRYPHKIEGVPSSNISRDLLKAIAGDLDDIRHLASLNPGYKD